MRKIFRKWSVAVGIATLACSGGELTAPISQTNNQNVPASVVITPPSSPDVNIGASVSLDISVKSASGQVLSLPVTWSSSDPSVATVSQSGVVTAVSAGTVIITATVGTRSAAVTLKVRPPGPAPVSRVTVALLTTLNQGDSASASASAFDAAGNAVTGRAVTWSSRNVAIARVSSAGKVTAVGAGTTTIDAVIDGVTGSATITVAAQPVTVALITVTMPDSSAVLAGQTVQATAVVFDNFGNLMTNAVITWSSSNAAVATVSPTGVITSVASGTALITASTGGKSGSAPFVVGIPSLAPVAVVTVTAPRATLFVTQQLTAVPALRDAAGNVLTNRVITWSTLCPSVATVSSLGVVTAVALGTCAITATSEGISGSFTVTVVPTPIASLSIFTTATNIPVGITTQLTPKLVDSLGAPVSRPTTWVSNNPAVATVSATGLVTGISSGSAIITATSAGFSASVSITVAAPVVPPVASVSVTAASTVLQPTQGTQATAVTKDSVNNVLTGRVINWSSSNNGVASVTPQGFINPQAAGTTTITAVSEGKSGSVTITVPAVATVNVVSPQSTLQPTQTTQATATLLDAGASAATNRTIVWTSSNTNVATVSATGLVTAIAGGTTTISATSEGVTGSQTITIPPVASVSLSAPNTSPFPQQTTQITATLLDAAASPAINRTTIWTSSAPSVAMVSSTGLVTALSIGTAVITATAETKSASVTITVVQPTVSSIQITANRTQLLLGQVSQLSTLILDNAGRPTTTITPTWTSNNPAKATISPTGLITAVGGGTGAVVTFTAAVGNVTATATLPIIGHPAETVAALPQVYLNTTMPGAPAPGGVVRSATNATTLYSALAAAQPGDVIELANGVVFTGNFILPNKNTTSTSWIVIRPANTSGLPAPGSRMTPSIAAAANLPILQSPNNLGAFMTAPGAHHYRIVGIEVRPTVTNTGLVRFGDDAGSGQITVASIPHDLIADRMYIHGNATTIVRRCVSLNSASSAVIDSYISDCHDTGSDSQAIAGWNGPGPFKIVNNYLEAAGEIVLFGGADPIISGLIPGDIEIRRNHFTRPPSWKGVWLIKNLFELKSAQRVLVEGNLFENNWVSGQAGTAILIKSANQDGTAPWQGTRDVTFRLNMIRNIGGGFAIEALNDARPGVVSFHTARVTISHNIIHTINTGIYDGSGNGFLILGDPADLIIANNTVINPTNKALELSPGGYVIARLAFRDNIINAGQYGIKADGLQGGTVSLDGYAPGNAVFANVLVYYSSQGYPAQNFYPTAVTGIGFANASGLDFHLTSSSSFKAKSTDMSDPGADIDAVNAAIAGVIVP